LWKLGKATVHRRENGRDGLLPGWEQGVSGEASGLSDGPDCLGQDGGGQRDEPSLFGAYGKSGSHAGGEGDTIKKSCPYNKGDLWINDFNGRSERRKYGRENRTEGGNSART